MSGYRDSDTAYFVARFSSRWIAIAGLIIMSYALQMDRTFAQQIVVQTPWSLASQSYFETHVLGWEVFGPGFFLRRNPGFVALSPVSSLGGAHFGWAGRIGPLRYRAQFLAAQGFRSTYTATVPMITVTNGYGGHFVHAAYRPFILQTVPIVDYPSPVLLSYEPTYAGDAPPSSSERPGGPERTTMTVVDEPPVPVQRLPAVDDPPLILGKPKH